ncbi:MAG: nuclear transport factor 2 family protein, partial [Rhodothermales bacterium]|nr:nuclear transport factor 2 family protein [Rhodothermales bacterium]
MLTLLMLAAVVALPARAQGTYSSEGPVADQVRAAIAAYEAADWDAFRGMFAEDAYFVNNGDTLSLDERMAEHMGLREMFDDVGFVEPVVGVVENDGQTWGLIWGNWTATHKETGETVNVMVHVASLRQD